MFALLLTEGMNPFYQNITSFPTVVFTFFLALTTLYWLVAVLGVVSIDVLDFDLPDADQNIDSASDASVLAGLMLRFGLQGVPVTIIISLIGLFGWLLSYYAVHFLFPWVPSGILQFIAGLPVFFVSLYISVMMTAQVIKPLRPLFSRAQQESVKYVLGQVAIVRTSRVDDHFGEAIMADGGAGLILKVRSTATETFKKGDRVVLFEYLKETNIYRVISEKEFTEI